MADLAKIKEDYLYKIKCLYRQWPIENMSPYVGCASKSLYGSPYINLYMQLTPDKNIPSLYGDYIYGLIKRESDLNYMVIYSDYSGDWLGSLENLSAANIVKLYNTMDMIYTKMDRSVTFPFKCLIHVGDTILYDEHPVKVVDMNDVSITVEKYGVIEYPGEFVNHVKLVKK